MSASNVDLLTVGESMLRFSVPAGRLLADAPVFDVHVAGTESNVAVAVARMGYKSRWLSQLPDNVLGHRIADTIAGQGVDCSYVNWSDTERAGVYFVEFGASPRPTKVLYDRVPSAARHMDETTFDLSLVGKAKIIHLTGITVALSTGCSRLIETIVARANELKIPIVFDVNYRALLWSHKECCSRLTPLLSKVDTLIVSKRDLEAIFEIAGDAATAAKELHKLFGMPHIAITTGDQGAAGFENGNTVLAPGYPVEMVDRIGAGDSFAAGVISGLLEGNFVRGLQYGVAMSALQLTTEGDLFRLTRKDVLQLMASESIGQLIR
ncbi:MAG TPA: sugar kinase [Chthoniobacterales bacterium]|nr:sugar kinase [Chthoniobacterales bacterium]